MIKDLIIIANRLDSKGLSHEANALDEIIRVAGLRDEAITDESTDILREEDLEGVLRADHALRYAPDEEWNDPDSYLNSIDIDMDLLEDTNIMPSQVVGDEDLLSIRHDGDILDDPFLSEALLGVAEDVLNSADTDGSRELSAKEIAVAIRDYVLSSTERNNPEADDDAIEQIFKENLSLALESENPIAGLLNLHGLETEPPVEVESIGVESFDDELLADRIIAEQGLNLPWED